MICRKNKFFSPSYSWYSLLLEGWSCEDFILKYFELKLLNIHNLLQKWLNQQINWGNAVTSRPMWQKLWTTCQDFVNLKIVWDKVYDEMTNTKCVYWRTGLPLFRDTPHIPILQPLKYCKTVFSLFWWLLANSQYWLTILPLKWQSR